MTLAPIDVGLVTELAREAKVAALELFVKHGRSRRLVLEGGIEAQSEADERGWAVRATTRRASFFTCGTGEPRLGTPWPVPEGRPIRLPEAVSGGVPSSVDPAALPIASEGELRRLARSVATGIERAVPGARVERLDMTDGESESRIASTGGVRGGWRTRLATVLVEASAWRGGERVRVVCEWLLAGLRSIEPERLSAAVARQLALESEGGSLEVTRGEVVASPAVATTLLAGLTPLVMGAGAEELIERLAADEGLGSSDLTILDDGGLEGGPLSSPIDGEGTATQEVVLVEEGVFRQPLLPWWRERAGCRSGGCSRRDSWREPPAVGPSHLYLRPGTAGVEEIVGAVASGVYLVGVAGQPHFDLAGDRFELKARGLELRPSERRPVSGVTLSGRVSSLLRGLRSPGRDLRFVRHPGGVFGSPTVVLTGLELRG